ncbi:MAG: O-antigen ligase family protein [Chakrabartia godavariana]
MISAILDKFGNAKARARHFLSAPAFQALAPYRSQPSPLGRASRKALFFAMCVFLGVFYGFWGTVLPTAFIIILIIPYIVLSLLLLWVLPDGGNAPDARLRKLFLIFTAVTFLWPNYLAISLPGLPWLSMRRIFGLIMGTVFLVSLASSRSMRANIVAAMRSIPLLSNLIVAFFVVQIFSMIFSVYPVLAYKHWFNSQYAWTVVFFLSIYLFLTTGNILQWAKLISVAAVVISLIAIAEQHNQMVLWANHIPPFFKIDDEIIQRILNPNFRGGQYRSQAIFSVSLAMAEYLALAFTLMLHRFLSKVSFRERLGLLAAMVATVGGIGMSGARVGFVGLVVGIAIYFMIWGYRRYRDSKTDVVGAALTYGYPALMAVAVALILTVDALRFRILGGGGSQISNDARQMQFDMAPNIVLARPIFGYGGGRGADALGYRTPGGDLTIDTYILSIVLDYGIVGFLIFYGAMLATGVIVGLKVLQMTNTATDRDSEEIGYLLPLAVMLAQFFVIKTVLSQEENHSILFMIYGAILALYWRLKQREKADAAGRLPSA